MKTVVFSMPENNGATYELFSLDDIYNQYNYGDMYQIDKTVLLGFGLGRQINGSYTIDINGLNPSHIQPLNPLLKKIFHGYKNCEGHVNRVPLFLFISGLPVPY